MTLFHQDGPRGNVVVTRDHYNVVVVAIRSIRRDVEGTSRDLILGRLGLIKFAGLDDLTVLVSPFDSRRQARQVAAKLWCHLSARRSKLVGRVVVSLDRHRCVRHERVFDIVERVHRLAVARLVLILNTRGDGLVLSWSGRSWLDITATIERLEQRGVEARVAVLDLTLLVLHPHEHVVWVKEVLTSLVLVGVVTETERVITFGIRLTVDGLENVLGVFLEHLLSLFG